MEVSHIDLERMIRGRKSIVSTLQPRSLCFYFETILSLSLSPSPSLSLHLYLISESLSKPFSLLSFIFTISLKSYYHSLSAIQMEINGKRLSFLFFFWSRVGSPLTLRLYGDDYGTFMMMSGCNYLQFWNVTKPGYIVCLWHSECFQAD